MAEIVFRADASLEIGTGHVMRCLTLASALRARGHGVSFVMRALPGHLGDRIAAAGLRPVLLPAPSTQTEPDPDAPAHAAWAGVSWSRDADEVLEAIGDGGADWLVVDHYAFDDRWERAVAPRVGRIMAFDDLADRPHACDLLLDQNLGRKAGDYRGRVPASARILTGPRHAVLRDDFADLRAASLERRDAGGLRRIMVAMGGVDRPNATGAVLDALAGMPGLSGIEVEVVMGREAPWIDAVRARAAAMPMPVEVAVDVTDIAVRMARADLAIGAVGGTTWERCTLGLPALMLTIADNQRPAAEALDAAGAAVLLGDVEDPAWRDRLTEFLAAADRDAQVAAMSAAAAAICDGKGAQRIVREIERPAWRLRAATAHDAPAVFDWRYGAGPDPYAGTPEPPAFAEHVDWFARAVTDAARRIRILEAGGTACGYVRLDLAGGGATVSLCLAPWARAGGWGGILLDAAADLARDEGLERLDARVHADNAASLALFESAGYRRAGREGAFYDFSLGIDRT